MVMPAMKSLTMCLRHLYSGSHSNTAGRQRSYSSRATVL
jgi:hypothetical protein